MLLMSLACDAIALGSNQVEVEVEVRLCAYISFPAQVCLHHNY